MLSCKTESDGTITIHDWEDEEEFSVQLIEQSSPFIDMSQGNITVTGANVRVVYRVVGWGWGRQSIKARFVRWEEF